MSAELLASTGRPVTDGDAGRLVAELDEGEVEAAESSTVILTRPGTDGPELFMLERHVETEFAGGALVFPGGKVEPGDRDLPRSLWSGLDLDAASRSMAVDPGLALSLHVAAVRETFEEAGFLLGTRRGRTVSAADLRSERFAEARAQLAGRDSQWDWRGWLEREEVVLDLGALAWWSWWITPLGLHRRYSTRFFVAEVPADQRGAHDEVETVSSRWLTARAALEAGREGMANVVYPTRRNLEGLAEHDTVEELMAAARGGQVDRRPHMPEIVQREDGEVRIRHPYTGELDSP